ncbi:hypothetical protein [Silvibacterium dinghuense]|uniref:Uncharacterized protein n=1 Tax=Silvibacterium dinghuense TaxID=1560006 RepID=A0A4Q1SDM1_9BACT|nr:hypothetical protein [Silvibacterium dinghuense]RXS95203.1 hypothetical protein ESZ00_11400 [Silvibacterium dinghuense]GGH11504.1 hypothetical protein GCM10011586_30240 [Silvibacterium dinghuense]
MSQIVSSSSTTDQFVTDLNQLAEDLQSGNLSAAEQDYVTLSDDALNGTTSSTATSSDSGITASLLSDIASSSSSSTSFVDELNQLGTDLQSGNLTSAQDDFLELDATALNAASAAGTSTSTSSSTTGTSTSASQAESEELINAAVEAMEFGDDSLAGSSLSELASLTSSSSGANILEQDSESLGSSSSSASSSSSTVSLLA